MYPVDRNVNMQVISIGMYGRNILMFTQPEGFQGMAYTVINLFRTRAFMGLPGKNVVKNRISIIFRIVCLLCNVLHICSGSFKRCTVVKTGHTIKVNPFAAVLHDINQRHE
ncbi:Uncharacterised protein [Klebsiella pneumoniae]|nr:Uncharacterised protein [Klebsiella pneumoniae]